MHLACLRDMSEDADVGRKDNVHLGRKEGGRGQELRSSRASPPGEVGALATPSTEDRHHRVCVAAVWETGDESRDRDHSHGKDNGVGGGAWVAALGWGGLRVGWV